MKGKTSFVCFFWFVGWHLFSLGISLCFKPLNAEIHLPFGFIKIGFEEMFPRARNERKVSWRCHGLKAEIPEDDLN